ncbi:MAG: molybdopterin-binding protein, partial [Tsuneonella sp.]
GASVGEHDLIRPALERWGATIAFWRVAMRPGKPLLVARKGAQWVIGLPGNPVSAFVTAYLFVLPLLRRLGGAPVEAALPQAVPARLAAPLPAGGERTEFVRAVLAAGTVHPQAERDSSALRSLAASNALIVRPIGAPAASAGETAWVYPLDNGGIA